MSDSVDPRAAAALMSSDTAGSMLRRARLAQGMHIAVLAASIKVTQRKLELLEADRCDELPDATFARALAQAVCRALKIDPAPVLAKLPHQQESRLEHVSEGLNTPFRERAGRRSLGDVGSWLNVRVLAPLALLAAAALVYWLPAGSLGWMQSSRAFDPAVSSDVSAPAAASSEVPGMPPAVAVIESADPAPAAAAAASAAALVVTPPLPAASVEAPVALPAADVAPQGDAVLTLHARSVATWIELQDATGRLVISRLLKADETVTVDGRKPPFKLKVGNAASTEVQWRGALVDLSAVTRDNVARLELQ